MLADRGQSGTKCSGDLNGNDQPQALSVFSADACGTYGFPELTSVHAGRSNPVEQIIPASERGNFEIRERQSVPFAREVSPLVGRLRSHLRGFLIGGVTVRIREGLPVISPMEIFPA